MEYDLELEKIKKKIKENNIQRVCLQLPDGLKPKATEIAQELEKDTDAKMLIWAGSNFGACDVPVQLEKLGVDILINFGHSQFRK
ncbi:hypothetical protein GF374_01315 [Candidatus Woesearchaeota archaeon]|nr:hypothetical protein [Candidatus Woesearchaeota archaeon]